LTLIKVLLVLLIIILLCSFAESTAVAKAPYEATWMMLRKVGDSYVVDNYPSLWDDGKTKSPEIIKILGNKLTWVTYSDDIMTFHFDKIEERDNDVYFFKIGNRFLFQWADKKKHIAKWTIYLGDDRIMSSYLYIDSLYNTFPIVDYEWGPPGEIDEAWD